MSSLLERKIEKYIRENGEITVPLVQHMFSIRYSQARSAIKDLENSGVLEYESGLTFKLVNLVSVKEVQDKKKEEPENEEDIIARRRRELLERLRKMSDDD